MDDHKAEAEAQTKALAPLWAAMRDDTIPEGAVKAVAAISALAQVHATLYLAEQQRIANLIAFMVQYSDPSIKEDTFVKFHPDWFREITTGIEPHDHI